MKCIEVYLRYIWFVVTDTEKRKYVWFKTCMWLSKTHKPSQFCMQFNSFDKIAKHGKCFKYIDASYFYNHIALFKTLSFIFLTKCFKQLIKRHTVV